MENGIKIVANVDQLSTFDMIYIYHHIKEGSQINLDFNVVLLNGENQYKVSFKNFHLGFVNIDSYYFNENEDVNQLSATVFSLSKEKYLPIKTLDILVDMTYLKLVS